VQTFCRRRTNQIRISAPLLSGQCRRETGKLLRLVADFGFPVRYSGNCPEFNQDKGLGLCGPGLILAKASDLAQIVEL
jgi:hypothetical protein